MSLAADIRTRQKQQLQHIHLLKLSLNAVELALHVIKISQTLIDFNFFWKQGESSERQDLYTSFLGWNNPCHSPANQLLLNMVSPLAFWLHKLPPSVGSCVDKSPRWEVSVSASASLCLSHLSLSHLFFLLPATKLGQGNIFRSVCQQFCPWGGMRGCSGGERAWFYLGGMHGFIWGGVHGFMGVCMVLFRGACMVLFGGACVVLFGGHAWFYLGGVHGFIQQGACVVLFGGCVVLFGGCVVLFGGHAWFYSAGGHAWFFQFFGYNEIRSMSRRYASYWNAFLLSIFLEINEI